MRLGLLTTSFPRHAGDAAGHFVLGFARSLERAGHEVTVLAPEPSTPGDPPRFGAVDVRFVRYAWPRELSRTFYAAGVPDNLGRDPLAWWGLGSFPGALARSARRHAREWDAVISHWALPSGLVAAQCLRGLPHLAVLHSADVHALERLPLGRSLARRVAAGTQSWIFVSRDLRSRFLALLPPEQASRVLARSTVSPMGVDEPIAGEGRAAARDALGLNDFTALSMSRLVTIKGLAQAIDAAANTETTLLIAGEGPDRARLQDRAARRRAQVHFLGHVTGAEKRRALCAADAFVLPSRRLPSGRTEGTPTALLEAMAAGLPPVASAVGGVPEVVGHEESGLVYPPDSPAALGRALLRLRGDEELRRRLASGAAQVGRAHTWTALAPRFERALSRAVAPS